LYQLKMRSHPARRFLEGYLECHTRFPEHVSATEGRV